MTNVKEGVTEKVKEALIWSISVIFHLVPASIGSKMVTCLSRGVIQKGATDVGEGAVASPRGFTTVTASVQASKLLQRHSPCADHIVSFTWITQFGSMIDGQFCVRLCGSAATVAMLVELN